ncbi:hypothetical protein N9545_04765 [Salibacteraceae bacterium]|nr:hypothetical protein [Salibacteraceae bacterium]MDB9708868.1 hypothetical protein [Salibacteraceae bacterium]MDC1304654.1 hypothetical protein [Salibacteraceae bacterium]
MKKPIALIDKFANYIWFPSVVICWSLAYFISGDNAELQSVNSYQELRSNYDYILKFDSIASSDYMLKNGAACEGFYVVLFQKNEAVFALTNYDASLNGSSVMVRVKGVIVYYGRKIIRDLNINEEYLVGSDGSYLLVECITEEDRRDKFQSLIWILIIVPFVVLFLGLFLVWVIE